MALSMKRLFFSPILSVILQAQITPPFVVDQRLELIGMVIDLMTPPKHTGNRDLSQFAVLRDHDAVHRARALPSKFLGSTLFPEWILYYGPPPELKPLAPVPEDVRKLLSSPDESAFVDALRDFAKVALPLLAKEEVRNRTLRMMVDGFNSALAPGLRQMNSLSGMNHTPQVSAAFLNGIPQGGRVVCKLSPTIQPNTVLLFSLVTDPGKQQRFKEWAVTDVLKCSAETMLEGVNLSAIPEEPGRRWLSELQRVNKMDSPTWEVHVRRSLARALDVRVAEAIGEVDRSKSMLKEAEARMPWVPRLVSRWKELEQGRSGQATMLSVLPDLMKVFVDEDPVVATKTRMVGVRPKVRN